MRRSSKVPQFAVAVLVCGGLLVSQLSAAELHEGWATLSEASTDTYYRDRVHSGSATFPAISRLPELTKTGRPRQRAAAEALIELLGKKVVADAEAARSLGQMKDAEKKARFLMVAGGLAASAGDAERNLSRMVGPINRPDSGDDPNNGVPALYNSLMFGKGGLAGSATKMAEARAAASEARYKLYAAWESKVLPAIRDADTTELNGPVLEAEFTGDGKNRCVWSALRNVAGKTLTNVVVVFKVKDGDKDLGPRSYFIRNWPQSVVIRPDPFQIWHIPTGLPGAEPPKGMSATVEVWCDQGHARPADAKAVGFYGHRGQFVVTLVREGARYASLGDNGPMILEFTKVTKEDKGRHVEATLTRPHANDPEKVQEVRYRGHWETIANAKTPYNEVIGLKLTMTEVGAKPLPDPPAKKRRGGKPPPPKFPSLVFRWDRPHYLIELDSGKPFPVQPFPDAKAAK